jgi:hypothetical protein
LGNAVKEENMVILLIKAIFLLAVFLTIAPFILLYDFLKERLTNAFKGKKLK